jgi:hypothetical protein
VSFDRERVNVSVPVLRERRVAARGQRDGRDFNAIWQGNDLAGVIFDTFHDRRNPVLFTVTAIGGGRTARSRTNDN